MNVNSYNGAFPFASYFETHCFHVSTRDFKASICSCILTCRITVQELADFLVQHGAVNALNLDGGGSTTFVLNGILANFPSDYWWVRPDLRECCRCFNQLHFFYFICLCVCLFVFYLLITCLTLISLICLHDFVLDGAGSTAELCIILSCFISVIKRDHNICFVSNKTKRFSSQCLKLICVTTQNFSWCWSTSRT